MPYVDVINFVATNLMHFQKQGPVRLKGIELCMSYIHIKQILFQTTKRDKDKNSFHIYFTKYRIQSSKLRIPFNNKDVSHICEMTTAYLFGIATKFFF